MFCDFPAVASALDLTPGEKKQSILVTQPLTSLSIALFVAEIVVTRLLWTNRLDIFASIFIVSICSLLGFALALTDIVRQRRLNLNKMYASSAIAISIHAIMLNLAAFFLLMLFAVK